MTTRSHNVGSTKNLTISLRNRKGSVRYDPLAELRIGGLANTVLEKVLDVERALIRAGFVFPVGGSLLVIARKM